jgi:pantothenate kinase-related protein Tda10
MINLPSITTIIGMTGSGKSHLAKWIVKELAFKQKLNNVGLISTTIIEGSNKDD